MKLQFVTVENADITSTQDYIIWMHRKREHVKNTFSQYTLLLDFLSYYLSLLKMWILLQHRNMEYESIEKGNHVTAIQDSGMFSFKVIKV